MGTINIYSSNGANKAGLTYNGSGDITVDTEHLANTSSGVQSQLDAKLPLAGGTMTGEVTNTNSFKALSTSSGDYVRMYGGTGTGKWDIYGNGANLRFSDNESAGAVVIDTNVGIGTTSPGAKLHVDVGAPSNTDQTLGRFQSQDSRQIGFVWDDSQSTLGIATLTNHKMVFHTNGNSNPRMTIDTSGNVGIGTTSPSYPLHISGSGHKRLKIEKTDAGGDADIQLSSKNDSTQWILFHDRDSGNNSGVIKYVHSTNKMHFRTNDVDDRLVISSDGNVGIGTTNPAGNLSILSNNPNIRFDDSDTSNNGEITLDNTSLRIESDPDNAVADSTIKFNVDNDTKMIVLSSGNVGIGTTSPDEAKLTINADAGDLPALVLGNVDGGGIAYVHRNNRYLTSNGSNWLVDGRDPIAVIGTNSNSTDKFPSNGLVMHNESQTDNTFSTPIMFGNRSNSGAYNTAYAYIAGRKVGQGVDSNWSTGELWIDTAGTKHNGNDAYMDHSPAIKIRNTGTVDMRWQPFSYGTIGGSNLTNNTGWTLSPVVTQGLSYTNNASHGYGLTVAEPGYYLCYGTSLYTPGANGYVYIGWAINGSQIHHWHSNHGIESNHDWVSSIIRWCNAGDHITIENSSASVTSQWGGAHSQYYVWKVG